MCAYIKSNLCCLLMPQILATSDEDEDTQSPHSQQSSSRSPQKAVKHVGKGKKTASLNPLQDSLVALIKCNVDNTKKVG